MTAPLPEGKADYAHASAAIPAPPDSPAPPRRISCIRSLPGESGTGKELVARQLHELSRRADISDLARYFLTRHRHLRDLRLSIAAEDALTAYDWPGNVRELDRLMERAVALVERDRMELDDLPPPVRGRYGEVLGPSLAGDMSFDLAAGQVLGVIGANGAGKTTLLRALVGCPRPRARDVRIDGLLPHRSTLLTAHEIATVGPVPPALLTGVFDRLRGGSLALRSVS